LDSKKTEKSRNKRKRFGVLFLKDAIGGYDQPVESPLGNSRPGAE
jgi:hypothetical protein